MAKRFFQNRTAVFTTFAVLLIALIGIFAPVIAPNDPYETNISLLPTASSTPLERISWADVCFPA